MRNLYSRENFQIYSTVFNIMSPICEMLVRKHTAEITPEIRQSKKLLTIDEWGSKNA